MWAMSTVYFLGFFISERIFFDRISAQVEANVCDVDGQIA
jgi:hypothetical protein